MIWQRKDPAEDHFVKFGHQESRIADLEVALLLLSKHMLAYVEADIARMSSAKALSETLRAIIESRREIGEK